ncbi:DUF2523 family protein [Ralstonia pseudosolanacearum]
MPLAGFLMALVGPLARQLLVSLGIGLITYVGLDAAVSAALGAARVVWPACLPLLRPSWRGAVSLPGCRSSPAASPRASP